VYNSPALISMKECPPVTKVGVSLLVNEPSPSWPMPLLPQQ
jgi:hypothetical protein